MKRNLALLVAALLVTIAGATAQQKPPMVEVYKSPTCGCCSAWVDHLRDQGFEVRTIETDKVDELKATHRIPRQVQSCHTALVSGYVVEGHVPAADVARLLKERPAIAGIAVPGMPVGSPGMEVGPPEPYDILSVDSAGRTAIYGSKGK